MWKTIVSSCSCYNLWRPKIYFKCSFYKSLSNWNLAGRGRTGGSIRKVELTHLLYFSNFIMIAPLFCASGYVQKPRRSELNFLFVMSLPTYAGRFQHPSEQGVPVLPALTIKLWKAISMAHHTSRVDEAMESSQIFYQHGRRGWASSALVWEETVKISDKSKRQKELGSSRLLLIVQMKISLCRL